MRRTGNERFWLINSNPTCFVWSAADSRLWLGTESIRSPLPIGSFGSVLNPTLLELLAYDVRMDVIAPELVTAIAALVGAAVGSLVSHRVEIRREQRIRTAELYSDWVKAVSLAAVGDSTFRVTLTEVKAKIAALAPADVVAAFSEIERIGPDLSRIEVQDKVIAAALALRTHAKLDRVTPEEVRLLLFGTSQSSSS